MTSIKQLRAKERGLVWLNEKLLRQGLSLADRIEALDLAEREGWQQPPRPRRFSPLERPLMIAEARLLRRTASIKQVAAALGISPCTASTWCAGVRCEINHRPKDGNPGWRRHGSVHEVRHAA